jgi:hypothetical protein
MLSTLERGIAIVATVLRAEDEKEFRPPESSDPETAP